MLIFGKQDPEGISSILQDMYGLIKCLYFMGYLWSLVTWNEMHEFCLTKKFTVAAVQEKYIKDDENFD